MTNTRIITILAASALFAGNVCAAERPISLNKPATEALGKPAESDGEVNTGQDITKPVRRLDIRYQYQNAADFSYPQPLSRGEAEGIVREVVSEGEYDHAADGCPV